MVTIKAFKGLRYNDNLRQHIKTLVSPPYDIYESGDETDKKLKRIKENFSYIKKPLGKDESKYTNAKKMLDDFIKNKTLITEEEDSMYIYKKVFLKKEIIGLISALKLEEYSEGLVLRHEMTKTELVSDRTKLLELLKVNTAIIYTVFHDDEKIIQGIMASVCMATAPLFEFLDDKGINNLLWKVTGQTCELLKKFMQDKKLYIADGHHRYETALNYAKRFDETLKKDVSTNYVLTYAVPDTLASILPYNRIIFSLDKKRYDNLLSIAGENFEIIKTNKKEVYTPKNPHIIVMYYDKKVYELTPRKIPNDVLGSLDVSILQNSLLELLGYDYQKIKSGEDILYVKGDTPLSKIKEITDTHKNAVGFSLYPIKIKEVIDVAEKCAKDEKTVMPPKSTYFYPKPYAGLVSYKF